MNQVNSYRKINFETAIKNVGLFADNLWETNASDKEFKQKNQDLWIRFNEAEELSRETGNKNVNNVETVKDRIPQSRLASYGNFAYDKSEDLFYNQCINDNTESFNINNNYTDKSEFWMCAEIEKEFRRLINPIPVRSSIQQCKMCSENLTQEGTVQSFQTTINENSSQWLHNQPWPIYLLYYHPNITETLSNSNKSLFNEDWNEKSRVAAMIKHPPIRYCLNSPSEYELHMKLNSASIKEIWDLFCPYIGSSISNLLVTNSEDRHVALPVITFNCEVPEFYPKNILQRNWHMLPSASDPNYQVDLFPYQTPIGSSSQPLSSSPQSPTPPSQLHQVTSSTSLVSSASPSVNSMPSWNQSPTQINPQPIPVFQRPPEFYSQSDTGKTHRKRGGVEFSNLILLARNSDHENEANHIKIEVPGQEQVLQTTGTAVNGHVQCIEQSTYTELISPLTQQNRSIGRPMMDIEKVTLDQINMWLNKVYPQRGEHFSEMMNTVDTMYNFAVEVDKLETVQIEPILDATGHINNSELNQVNYPAIKNVNSPNSSTSTSPQRRRLYRDVLSGDAENKFAQLEQEALEQYQASDHNIQTVPSEETLAQRYQDLEREALEQYRGDRDDWFTTPVTGEDKGGAGHLEEDPDPPITITPVVSKDIIHHQEITVDQLTGTEEGEVIEEGNHEKEDTRDTERNTQDDPASISNLQINSDKPPVWMKRKKKKQDKKRKTMKHKKDTNLCKNQEKSRNKFSCLVNDFYSMVQNCLKEQMNRKLPKADQKKKMKQVIYHLNKMNNLILNSETLNEFKLHIDATNIVTFGGVIAPCVQMCLEMNNQEQNALYNIVKRTIILKTFSMLFMPCFLATYKSATSSSDDYKSKYMEITNDNDIDKEYHQRNNVLNLLQTKFYISKDNFKLCRSCFLNQILSRLAWSCFQTFDPFYSSLLNETNYQVFLKNTIFYHMTYNNSTECDVNMYYEKHCNDVMKHNEWNSIGYLTDENSGKYFINKNLYGLIKDWSWIYYLRINKANNFVLIDSIIDESAINYFSTLIIGQTDNINGLLFQINWQENEPCYHCSDTTIIKCFNETDFVRLIPRIKKHTNRVKYDNIRICNEPNQKSRNSRKSQFHNSLYKSAKNKFSSKNNNEYIRMYKKNEKRKAEGILLKRIQSDGALNRKKELYYENLIPSVKRLKRNTSLPTIDDHTEISLPLIHHNENEKTHYKKKFRKQNLTSYRKCLSDQLPFTGYERIICSGDEPKKEINFKHQNSPNKLKKMLTKKKSKFVEKESIKSSGLNEQSCKHSCNLQ